jgi:hypothetical protein
MIDWRFTPEAPGFAVQGLDHPRGEVDVHPPLLQARPPRA